jgi:uncharacterized membrane protein
VVLVPASYIWVPMAVVVTMFYAGYRVVRWFCLMLFAPPAARPELRRTAFMPRQAVATAPVPPAAAVVKPHLVWLRELIGSLLISSAVVAATCVVMVLIMAHNNNKSTVQPAQCAWLFLTSLAGTWTVLVAGKFWEAREGEPMLRRFILMTLGLGLGLVAASVAEMFIVRLTVSDDLMKLHFDLPANFYDHGRPLRMAYMAAFATLLALVRWWRQSDPLRATRLSLVSIVVSVIAGHIVALAWQFPEPWLMMTAGCMSVAVQLASPWVPTYARLKPQRKRVI